MVLPIALGVGALALGAIGAVANMYQQSQNKKVYQMNESGYKRQLDDWNKNVGSQGRTIRYPEHSYPGNIYALGVSRTNADASIVSAGAGFGDRMFSQLKRWV